MRNLKVLYTILFALLLLAASCVSMVSLYIGGAVADAKWQPQRLNYEQRLGTESAKSAQLSRDYKENFDLLAGDIEETQQELKALRADFNKESIKRDKYSAAAIAASKNASEQAASASQKAAALGQQLSAQQRVIVAKADEAVSAAKATENKIDTAVRPVAGVPAREWAGGTRH